MWMNMLIFGQDLEAYGTFCVAEYYKKPEKS